jgi:2-oxo-3-hexenedioate decarboxylase
MSDPHKITDALLAAERTRTPIQPFTRNNPFLDTAVGYAAQESLIEQKCAAGEWVVGFKLGLTSKVKRDALGIREPVYGRITEDMLVPPGQPITVAELIHPRAEPELALVVGRPISPGADVAAVLAAIDAVYPAIEVADSRYSEPFRLVDSVADNAGAARVVLGDQPRKPGDLVDLHVLGCVFSHPDGPDTVVDTAAGGAAMGHPAAALAWLAGALAARDDRIEPGTVVLTGGLTAAVPLRVGERLTAEFDGLGLVEVRGG